MSRKKPSHFVDTSPYTSSPHLRPFPSLRHGLSCRQLVMQQLSQTARAAFSLASTALTPLPKARPCVKYFLGLMLVSWGVCGLYSLLRRLIFWMNHHSFHSKPSSVLFLYDNFVIFLRARARPREL